MTAELLAWIASRNHPVRDWPAATEPDFERYRDEDYFDFVAADGADADWHHPRGPYYPEGL